MIDTFYDRVERVERPERLELFAPLFPGGVSDLRSTAEQRSVFVSTLSFAADDAAPPSDPGFRSALLAYLEWGTRLAFENSQPGASPVESAPVPRWGWGEAPPHLPV